MLRVFPLIVIALLAGCETYRTEYHRRPAFYQQAALGDLPDRVVLDDGTVLVYRTTTDPREVRRDGERKPLKIREENEDGSITLRALVPEHVLANLLNCLHNEEYELIYNELLSSPTREAWERDGNTLDDFIDYFETHRPDLIQAVNRIYVGMSSFETVMEHLENGVIECRLRASGARGLKFSRVRVIPEGPGLKLVNVR